MFCYTNDCYMQISIRRLSKLASDKLVENNPAIADLSDQNRPTKLGEAFKELYDCKWTDAFEALATDGRSDEQAIRILRETLQVRLLTYKVC